MGPKKTWYLRLGDQKLPSGISESAKDFTKVYRRNPCFLLGSAAVSSDKWRYNHSYRGYEYIPTVGFTIIAIKSDLNCIPKYPWNVASPGNSPDVTLKAVLLHLKVSDHDVHHGDILHKACEVYKGATPGEETGILYQWSTDIIRYLRYVDLPSPGIHWLLVSTEHAVSGSFGSGSNHRQRQNSNGMPWPNLNTLQEWQTCFL